MRELVLVSSLVFFAGTALAEEESWNPTPSELRLLPPYCAAKVRSNSDDIKYLREMLGMDFIHMHHYCRGLALISRSYKKLVARERLETLRLAAGEFEYVLGHVGPGFILMPEVFLNRGQALKLANRPGEAVQDLKKALQGNSGLVQAYALLADAYADLKDNEKALLTISEGLRHRPGVKSLMRRYEELGGKLPYPEPYEKREDDKMESPQPDKIEADEQGEEARPAKEDLTVVPGTRNEDSSSVEKTSPVTAAQPKSKDGNNPWCRFCPD